MQEKFVNAIKTQVATKVSTKTKVLLGLMMMACLGGMFAIASSTTKLINTPQKNTNRPTTISSRKNDESFYALSRCPRGMVAINGNIACNENGSTIRPSMVSSSAETSNFTNNGWIGTCRGIGDVWVGSICIDPDELSIQNAPFAHTTHYTNDEESYEAVSVCPTSTTAIGGWVDCADPGSTTVRPSMVYSEPLITNFQHTGWIGACKGNGSVYVGAICANSDRITTYQGETLGENEHTTNDQISYEATSMCPNGKVAIGANVTCNGINGGTRPSMVYSGPEIINFQNIGWKGACKGPGSIRVLAICVDPEQVTIQNGEVVFTQHH
ncbi:MAG TPA: hypothetical protein PKL13_00685 [bacterium]|nr:hypothetical protein [bacterium]